MLIHKRTLGVLAFVWTGERRDGLPLTREAWLRDYPELARADWWELPARSPLGRKVLRHYPDFEPEQGRDGALVGIWVRADGERARLTAQAREQEKREALARGYMRKRRLRPMGVFAFLNLRGENG